jgi:oxygen-independent coproporphyrinogen-3 oxidase
MAGEEVLTDEQWEFERLVLGLRTPAGVPSVALPDHPDLDGLVERTGGRAVLTLRGRLLANAVTTRLVTGAGDRAEALAAPGTMRP